MNTLYVTDLDGTLLNKADQISEYSLSVINELVEKGMFFTYATARSLTSARIVTSGLKVKLPVIVYNGAFIMNASTGEVISSMSFAKEEVQYIIQLLNKYQISPFVYSFIKGEEKVSWCCAAENEGKRRYLSLRKGDKRFRKLAHNEVLYEGEVFYVTAIGDREELLPLYKELQHNENYNCIFQQELYREEYWCEIMPRKATKANAIEVLKTQYSCERVITFGDAINDLPMFRMSDEGYAVENAVTELKRVATKVIGSNEQDGVANWLKNKHWNSHGYIL